MKTASGVKRFQEEKTYGTWFNQLFALVKTRESCQPEQAIEPREQSLGSSSDKSESSADPTQDLFVPVKKAVKKTSSREKHSQDMVEIMKQLVEKDPMKDCLKYVRELEEREQEHELALARLIMGQPSMSSTPKLINVQHPGYNSQPTHHYSSHSNGAYGIATQWVFSRQLFTWAK